MNLSTLIRFAYTEPQVRPGVLPLILKHAVHLPLASNLVCPVRDHGQVYNVVWYKNAYGCQCSGFQQKSCDHIEDSQREDADWFQLEQNPQSSVDWEEWLRYTDYLTGGKGEIRSVPGQIIRQEHVLRPGTRGI